jgi:2-(1,2-epoxy-1,2-dihydrophenyl)acetyl-CoA isomerase
MTDEPPVRTERIGGRLEIVLNRPARRNAVTPALSHALRDAVVAAGDDPDVGCVVLRGAGGTFCSGLDLGDPGAAPGDPAARAAWVAVHQAIHRSPVPMVVALERFAINAGAALALAADLVVAGESAVLQVGEIALGLAAPMCQAWLHLRHAPAVGDRVTLLGDRIAAPELLRLGLVTEVVADDAVVERARALADRIAGHPAEGRRAIRSTWVRLRGGPPDPDAWFAAVAGLAR